MGRRSGKHRKKSRRPKLKKRRILVIVLLLFLVVMAVLGFSTISRLSKVKSMTGDGIPYSIRGVDVSSYQGEIDWATLAEENISFAFIKATEGSNGHDKCFDYNWEAAKKTDLRVGAYHFMSFESSGEEQATNFINHVDGFIGMLPPVIDVELYGSFNTYPPTKEGLNEILSSLSDSLESKYHKKPIIYTNRNIYANYIADQGYENPIWIADSNLSDTLPDGKEWTFCQYSYKYRLSGYTGGVYNIDMNVFNGSRLDFIRL